MSDKPVILVVDDEKNTREGLARALKRSYAVHTAESGAAALEILSENHVDVMLSDLRMPVMDGMTLIQRALASSPELVCILLTAYGSMETAVEAMRHGATDFLTKPVNLKELELVLERVLRSRQAETENRQLREQLDSKFGMENIIGNSPQMQEVFDTVRQVAASRATVLIQGESGTGKELVAKAIHQLSSRNKATFVPVHCAALSSTLLESELFGHEKGAFTGATERRKGRFEMADGGTLFLDEIGEIDSSVQVKILRALEERTFERVGGQETVEVDARLVAATNRDLKQMVADGDFREDLFYRLYVVAITLPPLRERVGDIPLLLKHYLDEFNAENGRDIEGFAPEALDLLTSYNWPGNVRELRNVVEQTVVLSRGKRIGARDLPVHIREVSSEGPVVSLGNGTLEDLEKQALMQALKACAGNRTRAAEQLGISRRTLHRKIAEYGFEELK
ncbi:sigma-54-dependent transcriptional regulator [Tichowtungia aerotolerans]|uniref:Response regulator n=1 Tax=Tichowtungia aerotolerans TaxID=2697043 RepID=A0A6P1M7Q1_9BACT|nr:sigma-54 dependent transcriptional regulator [Tichowtungia aerotolerans]QHI69897.1 response regulator [Tichowtungia aerotolerans]